MISKNFHHVLRMSERMTLVGPPESMREHVVAASKAMKVGDWKACQDYLINDKMNAKVGAYSNGVNSSCNGCVCVCHDILYVKEDISHLLTLQTTSLYIHILQVWDLFFNADNVRNLIIRKVKEESLRTYLFSYSAVYDSLDLELLAAMFDLNRPVVHSIISKMIINEELMVT